MRAPRWSNAIRLVIFAVLAAGIQSCTQDVAGPRDFAPPPLEARKPPADDGTSEGPVVLSVDPSIVPQDAIVELTVSGENFEPGDSVEFEGEDVVSDKLTATDVKVSKNGRSLTARLTVDADAEVALYDVAVFSSIGRGRRGIGTQLLQVQKTNSKPADPIDMSLTMPEEFMSGGKMVTNELVHDTTLAYVGGECSVDSELEGLGVTSSFSDKFFDFRVLREQNLKGKALRDARNDCTEFPRNFTINITDTTLVHFGARHDEENPGFDVTLQSLVDTANAVDPTDLIDANGFRSFSAWLPKPGTPVMEDTNNILMEQSAFNSPYCSVPGGGPPMIFSSKRKPESDDLIFTFTGTLAVHGFTVSTRPYPYNVGHCTSFDSNGDELVLLLHLDLAYTVN